MDVFTTDFWIPVGSSVLCGAIIGLERQLKGKPSGIRTSIFICLGTCLFIMMGTAHSGAGTDTTRVLGQIVSGIGFLGAGVILTREGLVHGVTSAAVIWLLAAIGAMIGFRHIAESFTIALITVSLLIGIGFLEGRLSFLRRGVHADVKDTH